MKLRYNRVSTKTQSLQRQERNNDIYDKVFEDKASGKDVNRPGFQALMSFCREGDVVYFESFSRISRSLPQLLDILAQFEAKGVKWVSEKEGISTNSATGHLVVAVLGAIAEYERTINAERREYGYRKALADGTVGRPSKQYTKEFEEAYKAWRAKEITAVEAMRRAQVSNGTWYKMIKARQEQEQG